MASKTNKSTHIIMNLCAGEELFDYIVKKVKFTEALQAGCSPIQLWDVFKLVMRWKSCAGTSTPRTSCSSPRETTRIWSWLTLAWPHYSRGRILLIRYEDTALYGISNVQLEAWAQSGHLEHRNHCVQPIDWGFAIWLENRWRTA